jgi:two-component system response regulator AtoC
MRNGAIDFLPKPVSHDELCKAIERALPSTVARARVPASAREDSPATPPLGAWSQKLEALLQRIGSSDVPVLLQGETGVGKEVIARKLHSRSYRAARPFLKLNCAALPGELVESELFGYERGAFTGAFKNTPGKFEMAEGGAILLDEIGDMEVKLQAKLLQVLQDREFLRLGAKEVSKVDVRVMAATHCDLEKAIGEGRFREDLYYRLKIIDIHIPPLRSRQDEILPLAEYFIRSYATVNEPALEIPSSLRAALIDHSWPGNVRELENVMRKYLVLRNPELVVDELMHKSRKRPFAGIGGRAVGTEDASSLVSAHSGNPRFVSESPASAARPPLPPATEEEAPESSETPDTSILSQVSTAHKAAEAEAILAALHSTLWNRKQAAALLHIDYKALLYKMKKLGIGEKRGAVSA